MAMPRRLKVDHDDVFPAGAYVVSEVTKMRDFDKSTKDNEVQAFDEDSGLPVWTVDVMDADESVRKADRQVSVRIAAKVQPIPPDKLAGTPFRPVEFDGLSATPYVSENGAGRSRLAWSFRATGMHAPGKANGKAAPAAPAGGAS